MSLSPLECPGALCAVDLDDQELMKELDDEPSLKRPKTYTSVDTSVQHVAPMVHGTCSTRISLLYRTIVYLLFLIRA
jgi:hypothetical protein